MKTNNQNNEIKKTNLSGNLNNEQTNNSLNEKELMTDLFNPTLTHSPLYQNEDEIKENVMWQPKPEEGKDGVYSAVIKFIPFWKNPKNSIIKKNQFFLRDPEDETLIKIIDCPTSVGKKSLLTDLYFKLYYSDNLLEKKLCEYFRRRKTYTSLIQIIKDDNNPENVGKIFVWAFGVKIYNKILDITNPEFGTPKYLPFDIYKGRPFLVKIIKSNKYNNYDGSRFLEDPISIMIDKKMITETSHSQAEVFNFLKENSPDLSLYEYKDWDEDTVQLIKNFILNIIPNKNILISLLKKNKYEHLFFSENDLNSINTELNRKNINTINENKNKNNSQDEIKNILNDIDENLSINNKISDFSNDLENEEELLWNNENNLFNSNDDDLNLNLFDDSDLYSNL